MHDIRLAIALLALVSVIIFQVTRRLLRSVHERVLDEVAVMIVLTIAAYVHYVWGKLWIVRWIPLPSVIVLSNWFPLLLAVLAGVAWLRLGGQAGAAVSGESNRASPRRATGHWIENAALIVRRTIAMLLIVGGGVASVMYFIPMSVPECDDEWVAAPPGLPATWPVCLQTNPGTCSAAASATILNTLGIQTTEQEMARLCLTGRGTTWLGLYHGLSTKLRGTNHKVEFFETDIAGLAEIADRHPVLLCCRLDRKAAEYVPEYVTEDGWKPGTAHSVVYFGRYGQGQGHVIGDPSRGHELWSDRDLDILWTREGLRIGDRKPVAANGTSTGSTR